MMDKQDRAELFGAMKEAVAEAFVERSHIDAATHRAHHEYIAEQLKRRARCRVNRERIINGILIIVGAAAVVALVNWNWDGVKRTVREVPPKIERVQ